MRGWGGRSLVTILAAVAVGVVQAQSVRASALTLSGPAGSEPVAVSQPARRPAAHPYTRERPRPPSVVVIKSMPPVPGAQYTFQGRTFVADQQGTVRLPAAAGGTHLYTDVQVRDRTLDGFTVLRFSRWYQHSAFDVTAAFNTFRRVRLSFSDLHNKAVDSSLFVSVKLRSSVGEDFVFRKRAAVEDHWLLSNRVVPTSDGLTTKDLYYTVQSVVIHGTNVVNASQHKYFPAQQTLMQTPLLFYTARFQVRDAVFGFPIGSSINLVLPDGSAIRGRLGHASQIQVDWLPRGNYSVKAFGPWI